MPQRRTFLPRRQITSLRVAARITEPHGHDRDPPLVIESLAIDRQPVAQTITRPVVPRNARFMDARPRSLADDEKARGCRGSNDGPWTEGEMGRTDRAGPRGGQRFGQGATGTQP